MSAVFDYAADLWRGMKADWDADLDAHMRAAETETNGNLVSAEGRAAGVGAESLFTGSTARAFRYASYELLDFWGLHPRPSLADYEAQWIAARTGWQP